MPSGLQSGLLLDAAYLDQGYVSGYVVSRALLVEAGLVLLVPTASSGPFQAFARYVPGVALIDGVDAATRAVRQTNELGVLTHIALGDFGLLRAGVLLGVDLELDPTFDLADQSQRILLGCGHALSKQVLLYSEVATGGTFGFDGDNGKVIVEASVGLRIPLGERRLPCRVLSSISCSR